MLNAKMNKEKNEEKRAVVESEKRVMMAQQQRRHPWQREYGAGRCPIHGHGTRIAAICFFFGL